MERSAIQDSTRRVAFQVPLPAIRSLKSQSIPHPYTGEHCPNCSRRLSSCQSLPDLCDIVRETLDPSMRLEATYRPGTHLECSDGQLQPALPAGTTQCVRGTSIPGFDGTTIKGSGGHVDVYCKRYEREEHSCRPQAGLEHDSTSGQEHQISFGPDGPNEIWQKARGEPPGPPNRHFPQKFAFYNRPYSHNSFGENHIAIARCERDARSAKRRYLYITMKPVHDTLTLDLSSAPPWIRMHAGPTRKSPTLATMEKHEFTLKETQPPYDFDHPLADIRPFSEAKGAEKKRLKSVCAAAEATGKEFALGTWKSHSWHPMRLNFGGQVGCPDFEVEIKPGISENFHWEMSKDTVEGLEFGVKRMLIRCLTGEAVAAWGPPKHAKKNHPKLGKMTFLGGWLQLGPTFEVAAVLTALVSIKLTNNEFYRFGEKYSYKHGILAKRYLNYNPGCDTCGSWDCSNCTKPRVHVVYTTGYNGNNMCGTNYYGSSWYNGNYGGGYGVYGGYRGYNGYSYW